MKIYFLVPVALGIFSGTSLPVKAQPSVHIEQVNTANPLKNSATFIDGITISAGTTAAFPVKTRPGAYHATIINDVSTIEGCSSLQFKYALLLDMDVESITNRVLFEEIEKWWGTRYKYGGANGKGIDCSAYTATLIHAAYGPVISRTARAQYDDCEKLERAELQQGDLVFFKTRRGISHVGLYLGNGYFTHAGTNTGVTISNLDEPYWNKKFRGAGRISIPTASEQP